MDSFLLFLADQYVPPFVDSVKLVQNLCAALVMDQRQQCISPVSPINSDGRVVINKSSSRNTNAANDLFSPPQGYCGVYRDISCEGVILPQANHALSTHIDHQKQFLQDVEKLLHKIHQEDFSVI